MSTENKNNGVPDKKVPDNRKEFWLSSFSVNNRISVLVLVTLIAVMGVITYINIPKESFPNITVPNIFVVTVYPGVSPEDMESLVTRKLEDELSNISDIKKMTSTSSEGYSNVNLEFNTGINIEDALQKVREKVDLAKPELPEDAEDPIIQEVNLSEFPIMQINVSGDYGLVELKRVAEDLQDRLESIPSVLEVDLTGGLEREVQVDVDLSKLKYYNISYGQIISAIRGENVTIPGGDISVGEKNFLLRVPGQYKATKPIEDIVVKTKAGSPVYIRDVATVTFGFQERETYSYLDGSPVITLGVKKRSGENILETVAMAKSIMEERLPLLPPTTTYKITNDQSKDVENMVSNLENNIISGLILVVGVLLFFLGVRNASFVGISIPLSMFLSFIILSALGISMNMIVLFSLILALGMLVDNAIVVVENIYRYLEEGYSNIEAAKKGTGEVALPIITGTTTTLAAFAPIIFWPGLIGEFMGYLPKTLIITLSSSLFVGLVINPVICALFMRLDTDTGKARLTQKGKYVIMGITAVFLGLAILISPVSWLMIITLFFLLYLGNRFVLSPIGDWWQRDGLERLLGRYENVLILALDHRKSTIGIAVLVLGMSIITFGIFNTGTELFPENIPPRDVYIQVETPIGSDLEFTRGIVDEVTEMIPSMYFTEDINTVLAASGTSITSDPTRAAGGNSTNLGTVAINFVDYQVRQNDIFEVMEYLRTEVSDKVAGAKISIEKPAQGPPTGPPINLEIAGPDINRLKSISEEAMRVLEEDPIYAKLDGLSTDLPDSRPEVEINVDREKAALYELSTNMVGMTVRQAINGVEASKYRDGKEEYDIVVRLSDDYRNDLSTLADITIFDEGKQIPLSEVATWKVSDGYGGIRHKESERVITLSADVRSDYQSNAVLEEAKVVLADFVENSPAGYSYEWTGQQQDQEESFDFLGRAFIIALFLIAFILVSQFNSIAKPFIILSSVIMSTAGVLYGLVVFQLPIGLMAILGVISLAGVVVNNAIVLIDYVDILMERDGMDLRSALLRAGKVRFRPVILTAVTTTLGLVPLAIGFNFDFITLVGSPAEFFGSISEYIYWGGEQAAWWGPMAISVIVGLVFATALTLILVPVLYSVIERSRRGLNLTMFGTQEPGIIMDQSAKRKNKRKKQKRATVPG